LKRRIPILLFIAMLLLPALTGCTTLQEQDVKVTQPITDNQVVVVRKSEIEALIRDRVNDGEYIGAELNRVVVNKDYGTTSSNKYIALVYFDLNKMSRKTGNSLMRMSSDDLVLTLAKKGVTDIRQVAIFWRDDYNNRNVKYAYEYRNGKAYITDVIGE
jgi:hypothetical protein